MIAIIRIKGTVKIKEKIEETFRRMGLGSKYSCIVIDGKDKIKYGMLRKIENFVAYGDIEDKMLVRMIEKRAKPIKKAEKINAEKISKELIEGKSLKELGLKSSFRLHPPRGGLKSSKMQFPRGVLGNNKESINKLIEKML